MTRSSWQKPDVNCSGLSENALMKPVWRERQLGGGGGEGNEREGERGGEGEGR